MGAVNAWFPWFNARIRASHLGQAHGNRKGRTHHLRHSSFAGFGLVACDTPIVKLKPIETSDRIRAAVEKCPRQMTLKLARNLGVPEVEVIRALPVNRVLDCRFVS
jgi:hypothetical protein